MILFLTTLSFAHKPSFGSFPSSEASFSVDDPNISIVVYQDITCEIDQIWLNFEGIAGFEVYIQGGIPQIDRLENYKPHIALLAPGLPEAEALPFDVPEGLGAILLSPEDEPSDFYEPFTQTDSWIWIEEYVTLPEDGTAYLVGWNEEQYTGKMWIATGTVEDFSDVAMTEFIEWGEYVNNFHETGRYELAPPKEEQSCLESTTEKQTSGCNGGAAFILCLPLLFRRRIG